MLLFVGRPWKLAAVARFPFDAAHFEIDMFFQNNKFLGFSADSCRLNRVLYVSTYSAD